jgi:serine/threonine protein phosphatase PrpC
VTPAETAHRESVPRSAPRLTAAAATHPGLVRDHNEDALHADAARGVFVVVDGIGGQAAGERAAAIALDALRRRLERPIGTPAERVREALALANNEVVRAARTNPEWQGMGCVVVVAVVEGDAVTVGHVGDARLYALGPAGIARVTADHSPVGEREARGELSESEAMHHPRRHEVFRSLGVEEHDPLDPEFADIAQFPFRDDMALLLCSDGLSDLVPQASLESAARAHASDPAAVVEQLVQAALEAGGKDNVSVVFVRGPEFAAAGRLARGRAAAAGRPGPPDDVLVPRAPASARSGGWLAPAVLGGLFGMMLLYGVGQLQRAGLVPFLPAPPPVPGAEAARERRVGPMAPYPTIGAAIAAARPGDTVVLSPGTYHELVRLPARVSLVAERPRAVTLAPPADAPASFALVVVEGAGPRRIEGLRLAPSGPRAFDYGLQVLDGDATIVDVDVSGATVAGVTFEGRGDMRLLASTIHDNPGTGVAVGTGASPHVAHNAVLDNGRGAIAGRAGIELDAGAGPRLESNVIAGNTAEGVRGARGSDADAILRANVFEAHGRGNRLGAVAGARATTGRR